MKYKAENLNCREEANCLLSVQVEGIHVASRGACPNQRHVVGSDAAEKVVGCFACAETCQIGYLLEMTAGNIHAVDRLGVRHERMNIDGCAVGAPDGVCN